MFEELVPNSKYSYDSPLNTRQKFVFFLFLYNVKSLLRILFNLFVSFFVKRLRRNSCNKSHSCNFIFRHNKRDFYVAVLYDEGKSDFCFVIVLLSLITYNHWYNALYSVPAVIKRKIMTSYDLLLFLFLWSRFNGYLLRWFLQWIQDIEAINIYLILVCTIKCVSFILHQTSSYFHTIYFVIRFALSVMHSYESSVNLKLF